MDIEKVSSDIKKRRGKLLRELKKAKKHKKHRLRGAIKELELFLHSLEQRSKSRKKEFKIDLIRPDSSQQSFMSRAAETIISKFKKNK